LHQTALETGIMKSQPFTKNYYCGQCQDLLWFPYKPYDLTGFEPGSSDPEADALYVGNSYCIYVKGFQSYASRPMS
jgi:hypothetical protein